MRTSKYHNRPTVVDNIRFASVAESRRYQELKWMLKSKRITDLDLQPRYDLIVNGQKICTYIADFRYKIVESGVTVVEDVKGGQATKTPIYVLKRKLMKALHDIDIMEIE